MLCNMLGLFALRAILVHGAVMVFFLLVLAPGTLDVTAKVVGGRLAARSAAREELGAHPHRHSTPKTCHATQDGQRGTGRHSSSCWQRTLIYSSQGCFICMP